MRIALFTDYPKRITAPYGGGGETYALYMSSILAKNHEVSIFSNKISDPKVNLKDVFEYYDVEKSIIDKIKFFDAPFIGWKKRYEREIIVHDYLSEKISKNYDLFINASDNTMDGFCLEDKNIKCIKLSHFPIAYADLLNSTGDIIKKRLSYQNSYNLFLCNSKFCQYYHELIHGFSAEILYPPINQNALTAQDLQDKENIILYAGRIVPDKNILLLANAFKLLRNREMIDSTWEFVIIGNVCDWDNKFVKQVKKALKGYNARFIFNARQDLYNQVLRNAKIFWTAKGFYTDNPHWMEHFGMTIAESMANGCVPIVLNKGGHKEIVDKNCGYLWNTIEQLIEYTSNVANDDKLFEELSKGSIEKSKIYLMPQFELTLNKHLDKLFDKNS